jgi:acyl carrier protein
VTHVLIILLLIGGTFAITWWVGARQDRRQRATFVASRPSLPDEEYLQLLDLDAASREPAVAVRTALAHIHRVPPEALHPEDQMTTIYDLEDLDDLDTVELTMELEEQLDVEISDGDARRMRWGYDEPMTLAEFVTELLRTCLAGQDPPGSGPAPPSRL